MHDVLQTTSSDELTWERKLNFALDTARGMAYLHKLNVVHRDLKSHNLLVSTAWRVKIADFGTSRLMDALHNQKTLPNMPGPEILSVGILMDSLDDSNALAHGQSFGTLGDSESVSRHSSQSSGVATMTTAVGSPLWMSPELVLGQPYGPSTDVYSYGMVLFEIIEQRLPWEEITGPVFAILEKEVPLGRRPAYEQAPETGQGSEKRPLQDMMVACWASSASMRPTFTAIVDNSCFDLLHTGESVA